MANPKPTYPLKAVKTLLKINHYQINPDVAQDAYDDFGWGDAAVIKCLLKLNDKLHTDNPAKNHFYKTEPHDKFPSTMLDYYKICNGLEGNKIYTHIYIHPTSGKLVISSFKEL